jgi:hypothetical protein
MGRIAEAELGPGGEHGNDPDVSCGQRDYRTG